MTQTSHIRPTLSDVLDWLQSTPDSQSRRNMITSVRSLCRALEREPQQVFIAAADLRKALAEATPGLAGLSRARWTNVKSDVRRAMRLSGLLANVEEQAPLSDDWEALITLEPHRCRRSTLKRFGHFCSFRQLAPVHVADATVEAYFRHLDDTGICKTPERITRDVICYWNALRAIQQLDLSPLTRRGTREIYTLAWADLPVGLATDAANFREARLNPSPFDDLARPVRLATANQQDRMLRRLASAALRSGVAPEDLQSLCALMRPTAVQAALTFLFKRHGSQTGAHLSDMTNLVLTVAKQVGASEQDLQKFQTWSRKFNHRPAGMTARNRERLRVLAAPEVLSRLLRLPDLLMQQAQALPKTSKSALLMQKAVAIGILLVAPVRLQNLTSLDRARHFRRSLSLQAEGFELYFPAVEVKNGVDLHLPLPAWLMTIIECYLQDYQPLLSDTASSRLFPGRTDIKAGASLRALLQRVIRQELGLEIHPHLFRHLSALIFLRAHPGQYETVRQLLGHKSLQTTYNFYACFEQDMAGRMYNEVLEAHRADQTFGSTRVPSRYKEQRSGFDRQRNTA